MTSFIENIQIIVPAVVKYNPKYILDIGSGFGKYGLLIREAMLSLRSEAGDLTPDYWGVKIDCMDEAKYFLACPSVKAVYNRILECNAKTIIVPSEYDFILLIDVAEHWSREEYFNFVKGVKRNNPNCKILVSTPKEVVMYTERHYDSETHHTQFTEADFAGAIENLSSHLSHIYVV